MTIDTTASYVQFIHSFYRDDRNRGKRFQGSSIIMAKELKV